MPNKPKTKIIRKFKWQNAPCNDVDISGVDVEMITDFAVFCSLARTKTGQLNKVLIDRAVRNLCARLKGISDE
tara:strand:+ start:14685 stop:14903 length:219 start_codon:yes stop_codon:yes gene_type:complete